VRLPPIGAGNIGQAFARAALRAGRQVVIPNSRGPQSLGPVVAALRPGASAGTTGEAAASSIVVIAVPWASIPTAVAGLAWEGQIVIDATNPFLVPEVHVWTVRHGKAVTMDTHVDTAIVLRSTPVRR
jgi:predicted dinucleotide-binding enzyme